MLIRVDMGKDLPGHVQFINERGECMFQPIHHEWKPCYCEGCKGFGHTKDNCRRTYTKKWVPKSRTNEAPKKAPLVDDEGFTQVTQSGRKLVRQNEKQLFLTIHCWIKPTSSLCKAFQCTFLYEYNDRGDPWIVSGDFNALVALDERIRAPVREYELQPFGDCAAYYCLEDIKTFGQLFTWNNKQLGEDKEVKVSYLPEGDFDYSPGVICKYQGAMGKKPFRFYSMWVSSSKFGEIMERCWKEQVQACHMYLVITELRRLKKEHKNLNQEGFSDANALLLGETHNNPHSLEAQNEEREEVKAYNEAHRFMQSILSKKQNIGEWVNTQQEVEKAFLEFCESFLGTKMCNGCQLKEKSFRWVQF
ncbi:Endoglucanase [Bienertia sinuspersici]